MISMDSQTKLRESVKTLRLALEELDVQWVEYKRLQEEFHAKIQKGEL